MTSDENNTIDSLDKEEIQNLSELEQELLKEPEKKSTFQIVRTVIAISLFFGGFNLTILLDTVVLSNYLCSPAVFGCVDVVGDVGSASRAFVYSALKVISVVVFMVSLIVGGAVSDDLRTRFGNRVPMILLGSILAGVGYIMLPYVMKGSNPNVILIMGSFIYIIIYAGLGFGLAPEYALISELFTKEERGWAGLGFAGIGLIGTIFGVIIESLYIAPYLETNPADISWTTIGLVAGTFIILMGILTFILTPKHNPPFPSDGVIQDIINTPKYLFQLGSGNDANKDFLLMFIVGILWGGGGFVISSQLPVFIDTLGLGGYTSIKAVNLLLIMGVAGAIFAGPVGVMISKLGKVKSGMTGSMVLGLFAFVLAQSLAWNDTAILGLAFMAGFGTIFITAVNISLPADLVPRGKEGQFMGLFTVAANLSAPLVGIFVTLILGSADPEDPSSTLLGYSTVFLMTTAFYFGAIFILGFMHYESQIEGEYQLFYRRYLIAKGYISDKAKHTALKVSSSLKIRR